MRKKIALALVALMCTGCSGRFEIELPNHTAEPEYLTAEEAESRPLYQQLTNAEKQIYTAVYKGICMHQDKISLPLEISGDVYAKIYFLIEKQESGLYYIDSSYYTAEKMNAAQIIYRNEDFQDIGKLEAAAEKVQINDEADDYDKVLKIHEFIVENCRYAPGENGYNGTIYGCLAENEAHCEGYAKAFDYLAKKAGLCDIVVIGTTDKGENHAWNQVKVDNEWYNLDVTWNDTDIEGEYSHNYLLCSDEEFSKTHFADTEYFQPYKCTSGNSYYVREDLLVGNFDDAERILNREMQLGKDLIELKFESDAVYDDFEQAFFTEEKIFDLIKENGLISEDSFQINVKEVKDELRMLIDLK